MHTSLDVQRFCNRNLEPPRTYTPQLPAGTGRTRGLTGYTMNIHKDQHAAPRPVLYVRRFVIIVQVYHNSLSVEVRGGGGRVRGELLLVGCLRHG